MLGLGGGFGWCVWVVGVGYFLALVCVVGFRAGGLRVCAG